MEHLIEIPHTEKQNGVRVVLFDSHVLVHHPDFGHPHNSDVQTRTRWRQMRAGRVHEQIVQFMDIIPILEC